MRRNPLKNLNKMTPIEIQSKLDNAKALDFGTIFSQSIELYKKSWLQGFLLQLFVMILVSPFIIMLYVPFIMMLISQSDSGQFDPNAMDGVFAGFSVFYIILFIIGILIIGAIQFALNAAFFRILRNLDHGQEARTADLFYFLKGKYLGKLVLIMLVTILISIPAALLLYLPLIYVMVPLSFIGIMFSFNPEWTVGEIVGSSFRLGNKKWLLTFGLLVVSYIMVMLLTLVTCGIGSLFITAFMYHPIYFIYKETIGFDDTNELNQIGEVVAF